MKRLSAYRPTRRHPSQLAFTLVEMMVVMVVFSFIVAAIVALQIFALRMYRIGSAKLTTSTDARETMNVIRDQIRCAKTAYVGTYASGTFSRITSGLEQKGNALQIATGSSTNCTIYYLDTTAVTNTLYSLSNNVTSTLTVMARFMTNYNCFIAEDYRGNTMTDYGNNPVYHVIFQFNELGFPKGSSGNEYEFYYLSARMMRRAKD